MTTPDLSNAPAKDCIAIIEAAKKRLDEIKEKFLEEASLMGLTLAENGKKRRRRSNAHKEAD